MQKSSQSRSVKNLISPLRYIGKKYLSTRSDLYKESLDVINKADNIFRDVVRKQNNYLKELKKDKRNLEAIEFTQNAAAFLREQAVLIEVVGFIRQKFADKVKISPEQLKNIDFYITREIGKTPKYNPNQAVETKIDVENQWELERPSSISRWLEYYTGKKEDWARIEIDKSSSKLPPELISEAFLASWFWGKTKAGKELIKSFNDILGTLNNIFNANISTLKTLDGLRSQGDIQNYWDVSKGNNGFGANYKRFIENSLFQESWSKFENFMPQAVTEEEPTPEDKPQSVDTVDKGESLDEYDEDYDEKYSSD